MALSKSANVVTTGPGPDHSLGDGPEQGSGRAGPRLLIPPRRLGRTALCSGGLVPGGPGLLGLLTGLPGAGGPLRSRFVLTDLGSEC